MKEKIAVRKIWFDEEGVTEILGDMMILTMTVVLFAGVFLMVWALPTPDEGVYADFEPVLELVEDGGEINVTHLGGESLKGDYTNIYITRNDDEIKELKTQGSDEDNPFYGIEGDKDWEPGEKWNYFYKGIASDDYLQISIVDTKTNTLVMKSKLSGSGLNAPPLIMERWHHPVPAVNGSKVTICAKVIDPNGYDDVDEVSFNASQLNSSLGELLMEDEDGNGIFEAELSISNGAGNYEVTIVAKDMKGKIDMGRLRMTVMESSRPIFEFIIIEPNSVEVGQDFTIRTVVVDLNDDLNLSDITVAPEQKFYDDGGNIETTFWPEDKIPSGGLFETNGSTPSKDGVYLLVIKASDYDGHVTTKSIKMTVIKDVAGGNGSFNDTIWAYLGPESLDFRKFYYTTDDPPTPSTTYHLAVYIQEEDIGDDCYLHINVINHYYEDVYIDGNSKIRLLQIGGSASNKDISIVQNGTDFGEPVGTTSDGTWYRIPAPEDEDYFRGGEPVSLVFGPFDMQSAKAGDVFGSIMVLTGSYGGESNEPEERYGQTIPFQAIVIA